MKLSRKKILKILQSKFCFFRLSHGLSLAIMFLCVSTFYAERLPVKTYTVADGLLRDSVYKIKQDSRGFLWFCTVEGISRFDGYAFTNYTVADGLPERHVNDFLETKNGEIWIATDGGLAKLNPKGLAGSKDNPLFTVLLPDNPKAKSFRVLFEDENGAVWAGTNDGLYRLNAGSELAAVDLGKPEPKTDTISISSIIKDRRGAMWIGMSSGLRRILPNGEVERFNRENGLPDTNISTLHEDKNGRLWIGLRPAYFASGLVLLTAEPNKNQNIVERHYTTKDGLPADWIRDLFETSDGKFWVATTRGLCEWQGGETSVCKTYTTKNDLCDEEVWTITEDKDKNLWLGSRCGAKKWARYGFTSYAETDGMGYTLTNSIFENAAGELFVSFNNGAERTVSRFDGEKFELIKPKFPAGIDYFGSGWKQTVWQDRSGDWWFPTGYGLFRFPRPARFADLASVAPHKVSFDTKGNEIFRFFEDSRGDFWIMTHGFAYELWRWRRTSDTWENLSADVGISVVRIATAFVEDKAGNLWIGTATNTGDAALIRYRDGKFTIFSQAEYELLAGWTRDLFVDSKNRLWIANSTAGVLRLDDVNADRLDFTRYTPAEGLSSIGVTCLTEDRFGRIYIGTGRGLDRLNPDTGQVENFTTADGLPNSYVEVAYRDRQNNLWFGTSNGLARFVPEPTRTRQPPNIFITGLRVSGEPQPISILGASEIPPLELASDQRQVTVDFLGLGASLGEKLKYEYRFGDADWTTTSERTVNFANLGAGDYQFEVRAITADRNYSQPATVAFRIAAPFWQSPWFIVGLLTITAFLIYVFYRYRLTRLLEVANMRTSIATDLHDDIGSNLTKISILSEVVKQRSKQTEEVNLLDSIADISRESVSAMSDIVWSINPNKDSLLDLTRRMRGHSEEICGQSGLRLRFNASETLSKLKLNAEIRRNVYLIFKESLNNIVRHSKAAEVSINFGIRENHLYLSVGDDGSGFEQTPEREGNGLPNMKKRAQDLNGKLEIYSNKNEGAKIVLQVPLERNFWK